MLVMRRSQLFLGQPFPTGAVAGSYNYGRHRSLQIQGFSHQLSVQFYLRGIGIPFGMPLHGGDWRGAMAHGFHAAVVAGS